MWFAVFPWGTPSCWDPQTRKMIQLWWLSPVRGLFTSLYWMTQPAEPHNHTPPPSPSTRFVHLKQWSHICCSGENKRRCGGRGITPSPGGKWICFKTKFLAKSEPDISERCIFYSTFSSFSQKPGVRFCFSEKHWGNKPPDAFTFQSYVNFSLAIRVCINRRGWDSILICFSVEDRALILRLFLLATFHFSLLLFQ